MTPYFDTIESRIQEFGHDTSVCGTGDGDNNDVTAADIHLMTMVDFYQADAMEHLDKDFFRAYPGVMASCANAKQHAFVKSYEASVDNS
jgi:hypothetical protein